MEALVLSFFTFLSTLLGGIVALKNRSSLHYIMSFTAGVLLGVCFYDVLPEAAGVSIENGLDVADVFIAATVGFLLIHVVEKLAVIQAASSKKPPRKRHPIVGVISALGLVFHSFLDGVGIGLGFQVSPHVGIVVALAVIAHDFSDGLNTVTLMLANNNTSKKSLLLLILDAAAPVLGVASTTVFSIPESVLVLYLGFFAGFLLYIGASHLLPEAHADRTSVAKIGLTVLGAAFIFGVSRVV